MLEFVTGFIAWANHQSPQCDIIVCRKNFYRRQLAGDIFLVEPNDCIMVIEVKGNATLDDLTETIEKNKFFQLHDETKHIKLAMFAFKTRIGKQRLYKEFGYKYDRSTTIISKIKNALRDSDEFELVRVEIDKLRQFMSSLLFRNPVFVHLSNYIIDTQYKNDPQHIKHVKDIFPDVPQNVYLSMLANEFLKMNIAPDVGLFPRALAETMKESQLCIFKAKGSVFVTSDMPVVNIYGEKDGIEYDLLGMPITPELFLAFVDTVQRVPRIIIIDDNSVKRMNSKQINKDLLISNRIDLLSYIDFSIDAEKEDDEQVYQLLHTDKETALKQYEDMMSSKEIKYWR